MESRCREGHFPVDWLKARCLLQMAGIQYPDTLQDTNNDSVLEFVKMCKNGLLDNEHSINLQEKNKIH